VINTLTETSTPIFLFIFISPESVKDAVETAINNAITGIKTGKLKIGIKVLLPPALKAIPETIVKIVEKLTEPNKMENTNSGKFTTGFPKSKV